MKPRSGTITVARHGEPALSRKIMLDSAGYTTFWAQYEEGGLLPGQKAPPHLIEAGAKADAIFVSSRRRAIESARMVLGDRQFDHDHRLIEAPLPAPAWPSFVRMSPRFWGFFARFWWWWFNHHAGQESRAQATLRARAMARIISDAADEGRNVLVFAHGFFNAMLGLELQRLGWKRVWGRGYKYWSTRRFERK